MEVKSNRESSKMKYKVKYACYFLLCGFNVGCIMQMKNSSTFHCTETVSFINVSNRSNLVNRL